MDIVRIMIQFITNAWSKSCWKLIWQSTKVSNVVIFGAEIICLDIILLTRAKNALFIIMAAALTTIGVMVPLLMFSFSLGKLVGFAWTVIIGALVGILITRPAFAKIVQKII